MHIEDIYLILKVCEMMKIWCIPLVVLYICAIYSTQATDEKKVLHIQQYSSDETAMKEIPLSIYINIHFPTQKNQKC